MNSIASDFFDVFSSFRKLKISFLFPEQITHVEYEILRNIDRCQKNATTEGVTVSSVVTRVHMMAPAVSRSLKALEEKELIERSVNKNDRRNTYLEITPKGRKILEETGAIMREFSEAVFGKMGDEKMVRLTNDLKELEKTCEDEVRRRKEDIKD